MRMNADETHILQTDLANWCRLTESVTRLHTNHICPATPTLRLRCNHLLSCWLHSRPISWKPEIHRFIPRLVFLSHHGVHHGVSLQSMSLWMQGCPICYSGHPWCWGRQHWGFSCSQ